MSNEKLPSHALDLSRRGHDEAAGRILTRLAEAGDADAAAHLGKLYDHGYLKCRDPAETVIRWYKRTVEGGSSVAPCRMRWNWITGKTATPIGFYIISD